MQCNMVKVIWTFWRMKLVLLLQFYYCQSIAKFHIEIFIGQMHLTHTMKQSHVQWAEIDFERYYQTFIWLTTHRLQKIDTTKYEYYIWKSEFQFQTVWFICHHSVDESIIPYYGKHGTKQFIRGKPIRFGFKLWCITSSEGYLFHAEPYCGVDTDLPDTDQPLHLTIFYLTPIVRWAEWTLNWCTWHSSTKLFPWRPSI